MKEEGEDGWFRKAVFPQGVHQEGKKKPFPETYNGK